MNKYLAWTAAIALPLMMAAPAVAQTASPAPMAPMPSKGAAMSAGKTDKLSAADKRFVDKAAAGGTAEVQLAQLAQQKSQDDKVKDFAQHMIDDHTPNNDALSKLATGKGITPPSEPDAKATKMMTHLQTLDGKKFDHAYMTGQLKAHKEMLKTFETEAKSGTDPDLKSFAEQTIPTIQKHITMAEDNSKKS